jgi:hypothetical protein
VKNLEKGRSQKTLEETSGLRVKVFRLTEIRDETVKQNGPADTLEHIVDDQVDFSEESHRLVVRLG